MSDKYIAVYYHYFQRREAEFDTASEAAQFLLSGEEEGVMAWDSVVAPDGSVLAQYPSHEPYDELEELIDNE